MKSLIMLLVLALSAFSCSQSSVSGSSGRHCTQGRICESASDTSCYSPAVYEVDPTGVGGDDVVCTKR